MLSIDLSATLARPARLRLSSALTFCGNRRRRFAALLATFGLLSAAPALIAQNSCSTSPTGTQYTSSDFIATTGGYTGSQKNAAPYPSYVTVPGTVTGTVATIQVRLKNIVSTDTLPFNGIEAVLVSPGGQAVELMGNIGNGASSVNGLTVLIGSGFPVMPAGVNLSSSGAAVPQSGTACWAPSSYYDSFNSPATFSGVSGIVYPQTFGSASLNSFVGHSAAGNWALYVLDDFGDNDSISGWDLFLTVNQTTVGTTTSLSPGLQPVYTTSPNNSVTFTATVSGTDSSTPAGGTVTFRDGGNNLICSGGNPTPLSGGSATCTTSLSTQGVHAISAVYSGSGNYTTSTGNANELVEAHASQSGDTWCNTGSITVPDVPATASAYPSVIGVSGYTGASVGNLQVQLKNVNGPIYDQFLLVAPGGGTYNLDFLDQGFLDTSVSGVSLFVDDTGTSPYNQTPSNGATYLPWDGNVSTPNDAWPSSTVQTYDAGIPQVPGSINRPQGLQAGQNPNPFTLESAFSGAPVNGDWALYVYGASPTTLSGGWCIDFTHVNTGAATTTTVTSGVNPATTGQSVTLTATVKSGGSAVTQGAVTFEDSTTNTTLASNVTVDGSGNATYTIPANSANFPEGDTKVTATYNGTASYNSSYGTLWQRMNDATTVASVNDTTWQYCNTGAVAGQTQGAYTPNPSNIFVAGFPGTLRTVALDLNSFSIYTETPPYLASLIEAPGGAALDFFSNTGGAGAEQANAGNYIFEDSAGSLVPNNQTNIGPGSYQPTSYPPTYASQDSFISSSSGFYNAPSSFSTATTKGSSTFASTFPSGSNPNGTWSLFFNQNIAATGPSGAASGWCMQLTENPPAVTATLPDTSTFTQGQQGASFTVNVNNSGPGSTGDPTGGSAPMTVSDTLNAAFTYASYSGTGWSCSASGQTVTCSNDSTVAAGNEYPELAIDVNVSGSATGTVNNSATISGAGVASTPSNNDAITIQPAPSLSVTKSHTGTFTQGQTAEWDIEVANVPGGGATLGTITVADSLPAGYILANSSGSGWSCGGTNLVTCTTATAIAAGSNSTVGLIVNVPVNSPTSVSNTASAFGGGDPAHATAGTAATSNTDTVSVVQVPASMAIDGSQTQSATGGTAFGSLAVTVKDAGGATIPNYSSVTFVAGTTGTGATGTFSNSTGAISVATNGAGIADPGTFTADLTGGTYNVAASTTTGSATALFSLTNAVPTPLTPWMEVNNGAWQQTNTVTIHPGDSVSLGPQQLTGGTYSWSGPGGYSASTRVVTVSTLGSSSNVYTLSYTNTSGGTSTETFTINVGSTPLTPWIQVNNGPWQQIAGVTIHVGDTVNLGPQQLTGGTYSWSGPGGFSAGTRIVSGVPLSSASNVFTLSYTNSYGAASQVVFTITVGATPLTPWIQVNNGAWQQTSTVTVQPGDTVNLGPQQLTGGTFSWSGNSLSATTRVVTGVPLNSASNAFTLAYINADGVSSQVVFTINVSGTNLSPWIEVNGGAWQPTNTVTVHPGDTVSLGPQQFTDGTYSWSGPGGFSARTRIVSGVPLNSASNVYTLTYTNTYGVQSQESFTINVGNTPITPWIQVNGGAWQQTSSAAVTVGATVNLGPQQLTGGTYSWSGPGGYSASTRVIDGVPLSSGGNVYTLIYTNTYGAQSTQVFTITAN